MGLEAALGLETGCRRSRRTEPSLRCMFWEPQIKGVPEQLCYSLSVSQFSRCLANHLFLGPDKLFFSRALTCSWGSGLWAEKDTSHRCT